MMNTVNSHNCGNRMATKNQIAHTIGIMKVIQIIRAKSYKQICLRFIFQERVGIVVKTPQTRINTGLLRRSVLFPLYCTRRFRSNIIDDTVYAGDFVYYAAGKGAH